MFPNSNTHVINVDKQTRIKMGRHPEINSNGKIKYFNYDVFCHSEILFLICNLHACTRDMNNTR